jgi:hypothetical protein
MILFEAGCCPLKLPRIIHPLRLCRSVFDKQTKSRRENTRRLLVLKEKREKREEYQMHLSEKAAGAAIFEGSRSSLPCEYIIPPSGES